MQNLRARRLAGKTAVLTGGAGGIGQTIAKRYLEEGANVVLTGRSLEKLKTAQESLKTALASEGADCAQRIHIKSVDGSDTQALENAAKEIHSEFGPVNILINNAGSAGPRQELSNIPLTSEDLERLRATGAQDSETLSQAIGSLLGTAWFTTQAFLPYFSKGSSIINVSTIFSRMNYYGRIAYVVPKAALNALTRSMAAELGKDPRGIRVNTVYPGPVESERIHSVFATMDKLKGVEPGTTSQEILDQMLLKESPTGSNYLSKAEVAETIVFLGADESTSFSGHDFQVTHGLQLPKDSYTQVISRPNLRVVDLEGKLVWIIAGDQTEDACELASRHHEMGADVYLTFRDEKALELARQRFEHQPGFTLDLLDPLNPGHWQRADTTLYFKNRLPHSTIVLPAFGADHFATSTIEATSALVQEFFDREIFGAIAVAQRLDQIFNAADKRLTADPVVIFVGNSSSKNASAFGALRRSAIQQLIRVWRHENTTMVKAGRRTRLIRINQLVRSENEDAINLDLTCEWAVSLSNGLRQIRAIDISLAPMLAGSIQSRVALNWERQALRGLHLRKVALITGGSEGIGGEAARLLALSGARVALAARQLEKLEKARQTIIEELKIAGYSEPESRVLIIPDCDVADPKAVETMVEQTIARFGRIDYLINNAGIAGVEQMVVDMPLGGWSHTLMANLISNYDLMARALPFMKRQKNGHILNVSSHFGGVRHATVPYPNRSDYAVSKAGQRALAESLSTFLGPDVQINAVAPGPVDGVRLRGNANRPGLYARRAKLILENKRMNLVYSALVTLFRREGDLAASLALLETNRMQTILEAGHASEPLILLARGLTEKPYKEDCGANTHVLTRLLAERLLERLKLGKFLPVAFSEGRFLARFQDAPEPFFPRSQIEADATKIRNSVLSTLALQRMPSENDVAREMVFYLANKNVTGETLHPSCGLTLERLIMSGDFVGRTHPELLSELNGQTVFIVGDAMFPEMAALAASYVERVQSAGAALRQVVVVTASDAGAEQVRKHLGQIGLTTPHVHIAAEKSHAIDRTLDKMIAQFGNPDVVVSFPMGAIENLVPQGRASWETLPSISQFERLVEQQITHHLIVGKRASTIDRCRIIFVTPRLEKAAASQTHAFANFVRTTLRPLTVTAGQEGGRLIHKPFFNQIDSTLPRDSEAVTQRFIEAILMMSLPPPLTEGKDEATKTYTGTTITV
ncbi:MAG: SDR family NAD(P)-dependent oxidoreductase [Bdellovibrionota bacterium]